MNFNQHSELEGKHAFLSASNSAWVNYDKDKLSTTYINMKAKEEGTKLHDFASTAIKNRIKLARLKQSLNQFVNDCIGFRMTSEQVLYYSENCFGTADAISLDEVEGVRVLKIFDLKTGVGRVTFRQLDVYAALYCLEYNEDPYLLVIEQRIYQNSEIQIQEADPQVIKDIMNRIIEFDMIIEKIKY